MKPLTAKQAAILNYIMDHVEQNGYPPTLNEMMVEFGYATKQGPINHLNELKEQGYIKRTSGPREIVVLKDPNGTNVNLSYLVNEGV